MATTKTKASVPSFADRVLHAVADYRSAPDRLERDRRSIERLRAEIRNYERKYEIPSSEIHDRIDNGKLEETADVSNWIFAVNKLARAEST